MLIPKKSDNGELPAELAQDQVSISSSSSTTLPYYNLSDRAFFWHALILHISCLALAIVVKKIDVIFDLAGAICCAFSIFFFPAIGFLVANRRYGQNNGASEGNENLHIR